MSKLNTRANFINVLVDCKGYGIEEAKEEAKEYDNNLEEWLGDSEEIKKYKAFCQNRDSRRRLKGNLKT